MSAEVGNARSRRLINAPPNLSSCPSNSGSTHPNTFSGFTVIVTRLTVPVGTGDEVERIIGEAWPLGDFSTRNSGGRRCTRHAVFEVPLDLCVGRPRPDQARAPALAPGPIA
jgi:hypothetical protein